MSDEDRRVTIVRTWRLCRETALWWFRKYGRDRYYCQPVKDLAMVDLRRDVVIPPTIEVLEYRRFEGDGRWWVECDGVELDRGDCEKSSQHL
jgi:hypothetical protein